MWHDNKIHETMEYLSAIITDTGKQNCKHQTELVNYQHYIGYYVTHSLIRSSKRNEDEIVWVSSGANAHEWL